MNKSIMMGRVVKDSDLRYTQTENGELAIANFRLAVDRKFVRRGDPEADFFSCTAFGRKAEFAEKYLFKGIKILVVVILHTTFYQNLDPLKQIFFRELCFSAKSRTAEEICFRISSSYKFPVYRQAKVCDGKFTILCLCVA